ncbi:T9SS type A sorting domain-containing protein [Luteirhabdus pelagi]|uniref:T9SS type A sorting domain-containing protein n=1 Tax=Luteirhabdus pelagi TaxID=2792783 RepID=UPI001939DED6|nr:T9SS type A sorting domain-containing protein [Luteirhabdus pelagi]
MKRIVFTLSLVLNISLAFSQNDCLQYDGNYEYRAELNIAEVPVDFDKNDFLSHITALDDIAADDLNTLSTEVIAVYKIFPMATGEVVTIEAQSEIYPILSELENAINFHFCVENDCSNDEGEFQYLPLLYIETVPNDFDKNDFIDFIEGVETVSNEDLATLTNNITAVEKTFPSSQSGVLVRVVTIAATGDLYPILDSLENAIEYMECGFDEVVLGMDGLKNNTDILVYPNPITDNSVIKIGKDRTDLKWEVVNTLGEIIHQGSHAGADGIEIGKIAMLDGVYFVRIHDKKDKQIYVVRIVK